MACSSITTWYINTSGTLYGCGAGNVGQQGYGSTYDVAVFSERASNVKQVACSVQTTWYINTSGDLYGCGSDQNGQQGVGGTVSDVKTFAKVSSNVSKIICSEKVTWYIRANGDLYGCGEGIDGQQSSGSQNDVMIFSKRASNVEQVACCDYATWYIDNNGDLYGCGWCADGLQGNGNTSSNIYIFENKMQYLNSSGGNSSGGNSSGGNTGCVFYDTNILLADGTTKEAKDIQVGDTLQTYNEDTKEFEPNKVLLVHKNSKNDVIKVTFNDDSFIELTSGHPFLTQKGWASYDNSKTRKENLYNGAELYQLEIGDSCLCQDNTYKTIKAIEYENIGNVDVYDFTIEKAHTFIGEGIVLHNAMTSN